MQLQVGKAYLTRDGYVVVIVSEDENAFEWPFTGDNELTYHADGSYVQRTHPLPQDLIAEVEELTDGEEAYDGPLADSLATETVLDEVFEERERQEKKWGVQNHGKKGWLPILLEEVGEVARAICEKDPVNYREELIQVAAVCVAMVECYDRKAS